MTGHDDIDWARLEALFPDLLDTPPAQRARFLDRHCKDAPALRRELEAMLAASERATVFDRMPQVVAQDEIAIDELQPLAEGTRIGAWRIVRMIGRGGMGEVYLAQRADGGFAQQAAIKLLHGDAARHAQRFEEERRILAQLSHPNIARLLDGGVHGERAWMAMEFIEGRGITEHCRSRALPLPARMKLFHQICAAVAHAHASLIIHRDLKPSNILVNEAGQVKLLDFGIAKLIDPNAAPLPTHTTAFTPDHAAPEQIEGGQITTATDIYALGVVLYETLSGRLPWSFGDTPLSRAIDRLLREDPPPMSAAAAEVGADGISAQELQGDLDAIAARCLRRLPQDRYATVQALQEDLDRHARREPVFARQGGRQYRLKLWLRRNRMLALAVTLACVAVLSGLGIALWQAREARREAVRAEQVKNLLLSAFREQDPLLRDTATRRTPTQVIEGGLLALRQQLGNDPQLRSELLDDLGEIQANLGDLEGARKTLLDALAQRKALHGDGSAEVAETDGKLAYVAWQAGDYDATAAHARDVLAILERGGKAHSPEAARAKMLVATALINRKEREQAMTMAEDAIADLTAALGPRNPETISARSQHAQMLVQLRRDDDAIVELRDIVAKIEAGSGAESPRLLSPLNALAGALRQAQKLDEADRVYAHNIALGRKLLTPPHIRLATALSRYAALKIQQDDYATARALLDEAEAAMPADAPSELAQLLSNRAKLYMKLKQPDAAERDFRRAFELRRQANGDDDGVTWYAASQWGRALAQQGKLQQAERVQRDALARLQKILGPDGYQNALLLDALAETLMAAHRYDEAAATLQRALALTLKEYPKTHALYKERAEKLQLAQQAENKRG